MLCWITQQSSPRSLPNHNTYVTLSHVVTFLNDMHINGLNIVFYVSYQELQLCSHTCRCLAVYAERGVMGNRRKGNVIRYQSV